MNTDKKLDREKTPVKNPETEYIPTGYEKKILATASKRDARTRDLLRELVNMDPDKFIIEVCRLARPPIREPDLQKGSKDSLTRVVLDIQKYAGFGDIDDENNRDGKFGPITLAALFNGNKRPEFAPLKRYTIGYKEITQTHRKRVQDLRGTLVPVPKQAPATRPQAAQPTSSPEPQPQARPTEATDWDIERTKLNGKNVITLGDSLTYYSPGHKYKGFGYYLSINGERPITGSDKKYARIGKKVNEMKKHLKFENDSGNLKNLKAAVVFGGTNDVISPTRSAKAITDDLEEIISILRGSNSNIKIILVTLAPRNLGIINEKVFEVNKWIRKQKGGNIAVIDLYKELEDPGNQGKVNRTLVWGDFTHFKEPAYKALAKAVEDTLYTGKYKPFKEYIAAGKTS
jgi:lysophospholipase L1-like esterase